MSYTPWQTNGRKEPENTHPVGKAENIDPDHEFWRVPAVRFFGGVFKIIAFLFVPNFTHATPPNDLIEDSDTPNLGRNKKKTWLLQWPKTAHSAQRFSPLSWVKSGFQIPTGQPSPDSQKNRFLVSMPVRWVGRASFLSKDGESRQMVLSEHFGRWLLATCRS